ncbi:MAG TPA: rhomboid family intramembrane serine protease [Caulobacteraceae bacterium]|nr:rhomboid family intramembrane serine protease [Caulobacteraceae bacterium]
MTDPWAPDARAGAWGGEREPFLKVAPIVAVLVIVMLAAHAARVALHLSGAPFAFTPADLRLGRSWTLLSYQFVHGSWAHVLMNSAFTLAFGAPVARYLGGRAWPAAVFLVFFLSCGVIAALGYFALSPRGGWALVGASGAASGLMGAAALLIEGHGVPGSPLGRTALGMTIGWVVINAVLGASGLTPGAAGVPVAWQAHIIGYAAGQALIVPAALLVGARRQPRRR